MKILVLKRLLFLLACGYKPTSHFTKEILGDKIYVSISMPLSDPQSGIVVRDALNEAISFTFKSRLVSINEAKSRIEINKIKFTTTDLQKDENGFTILYRTSVHMEVYLVTDTFSKRFYVEGFSDYTVSDQSLEYEAIRINSIKEASLKATQDLVTKITSIGAIYVNE